MSSGPGDAPAPAVAPATATSAGETAGAPGGQPSAPLLLSPRLIGATCVGYLHKLGAIRKSWRRRWFMLTDAALSYAVSPDDVPKGFVLLSSISEVRPATPAEVSKPNAFCLVTPERTYLCFAGSALEMETWVENIQKAIHALFAGPPEGDGQPEGVFGGPGRAGATDPDAASVSISVSEASAAAEGGAPGPVREERLPTVVGSLDVPPDEASSEEAEGDEEEEGGEGEYLEMVGAAATSKDTDGPGDASDPPAPPTDASPAPAPTPVPAETTTPVAADTSALATPRPSAGDVAPSPAIDRIRSSSGSVTSPVDQRRFKVAARMLVRSPTLESIKQFATPASATAALREGRANLSALRHALEKADPMWIGQFVSADDEEESGLSLLLTLLSAMSLRVHRNILDAMQALHCVQCIKAVLNHRAGIEFLEQGDVKLVLHMAGLLSTENILAKQQVWELLAVLSVFSQAGRELVIKAMEELRSSFGFRYRFSVTALELKAKSTSAGYHRAVLAFVNTLLASEPDYVHRMALQREFTSLGLLEQVNEMRINDPEPQLLVQIDCYLHRRLEDYSREVSEQVDLSSPRSVFDALLAKVSGKPTAEKLLTVLQSLLAVDGTEKRIATIWEFVSATVARAAFADDGYINILADGKTCQKGAGSLNVLRQKLLLDAGVETDPSPRHKTFRGSRASSRASMRSASMMRSSRVGSKLLNAARRSTQKLKLAEEATASTKAPAAKPGPYLQQIQEECASQPEVYPQFLELLGDFVAKRIGHAAVTSLVAELFHDQPALVLGFNVFLPEEDKIDRFGVLVKPRPPPPAEKAAPPAPAAAAAAPAPAAPPAPPAAAGAPPPAPPPAPPAPGGAAPPPPPPPPGAPPPPGPPPPPGAPPPPGGPPPPPGAPPAPGAPQQPTVQPVLPKRNPSKKMKRLHWTKLAPFRVAQHPDCIWAQLADLTDFCSLNYDDLEATFASDSGPPAKAKPKSSGPAAAPAAPVAQSILDNNASMRVLIVLKHFPGGAEAVVEALNSFDMEFLTEERVIGLRGILPSPDVIQMMEGFSGDVAALGPADRFLLSLLKVQRYSLRIDAALLMNIFDSRSDEVMLPLSAASEVARKVRDSEALVKVIRVAVEVGNFLNSGTFVGNASGVTMASLGKLAETKGKARTSIMNFIVDSIETQQPDSLQDMLALCIQLDELPQSTLEELKVQFQGLTKRLKTVENQIGNSGIKEQFEAFARDAHAELTRIEAAMTAFESLLTELGEKFLDEPDETLAHVAEFGTQFADAFAQNIKRREAASKAKLREQKAQEQKPAATAAGTATGTGTGAGTAASPTPDGAPAGSRPSSIVDDLLGMINGGLSNFSKQRSAFGSVDEEEERNEDEWTA